MNDDAKNDVQPDSGATGDLKSKVIEVLRTCYDPEIPIDIYELGLVYNVNVDPSGNVVVTMTLTSPACPVAGTLPVEVENKVMSIDGVNKTRVELVWDPPWSPDRMTEAARLTLGML
jgi:FeS assembly SUF system protein